MAKYSTIEKALIEKITEDGLGTSLAQLREAAEKIWAQDSPRIIKDYTDHGIQHYERIIGYIEILLQLNGNSVLNSRELYLLLAGVYMHDIGMQCDILLNPGINQKAINLGAKYDIEFNASTSNEFNFEEQGQIRKNHQYLSAAWIDFAFRTGETVLGSAAKSIPNDLVDDLMDICLHHSKIPISNCSPHFKFEPNNRKQFVAAILRFADELDIDSSRVSIETVQNFRLPPQNSIYWFIHNSTKVSIKDNLIQIIVRLNPKDFKTYGKDIDRVFINEFEVKNKSVLDVLARNGIIIRISNDSKTIEDDRTNEFPEILRNSFESLLSTENKPLNVLSAEIKLWLEALNYEINVVDNTQSKKHILKAALNLGTFRQNILIHCIDSEITVENVIDIYNDLDRQFTDGWLISDTRVSNLAREKSSQIKYIRLFNLSEFLTQMVWATYFDNIKSLSEADSIEERYVNPFCCKFSNNSLAQITVEIKDPCGYLHEYIDNWLNERGKNHLSVLGDFGSGKTWFCRHLTNIKINEYLKDPINKRLPLLITLRDFTKAITPEQLINDLLIEKYKLSFIGSAYSIFQELNKRGKILLVLDGFDEMANKVDKQTIIDNFWELAKLVDDKSKVILTSRTEYFRLAKESEIILSGEERGRSTLKLSPPKFEVIYLEEFNDDQIKETIIKQFGLPEGKKIANKVLSIRNLAEMSRKPVLIKLLLNIIEEIDLNILENTAQVYLYATNKLLLRNIDVQRTFTSTKDKVVFLCELAWEMILTNNLSIHYSSIPDIIKHFFGDKIEDSELDHWDFDLRNQTLLHRNVSGFYKFSHKSIAEFFVAYKFAAELDCLMPEYKTVFIENNGMTFQLPFCKKSLLELRKTFGAISLKDERLKAVYTFLKNMIIKDENYLWTLFEESRINVPALENDFTSQNLLHLLSDINADFTNKDLSNLNLQGISFDYLDLTNASFENSKLNYCRFYATNLQGVNFKNTKLIYSSGIPGLSDISGDNSFVNIKGDILVSLGNSKFHFTNILDPSFNFYLPLPSKNISSINSTKDGNEIILSTPSTIYLYDVNNNYKLFSIQTKTRSYLQKTATDLIKDRFCTFSESWELKSNTISVWNNKTKKKIIDFNHKYGEIFSVCFGTKSDILIAGGRNGTLLLFSFKEKKLVKTIPRVDLDNPEYIYSISLSSDESIIALGTTNNQLTILDFKTFKIIKRIKTKNHGYYTKVKFSYDGKYLLACNTYGTDVYLVSKWVKIFSKEYFDVAEFTTDSKSIIVGMSHHDCDISVFELNSNTEIYSISHKLNFSGMNIQGLKAPFLYIDFFQKRGAKGWYSKADLEKLDENELNEINEHLKISNEDDKNLQRSELIEKISKFIN